MFWLKRKFVGGADVDVPLSGIQSVVAVNIKLLGGDTVTAVTRDPSHTYIVTRARNDPSQFHSAWRRPLIRIFAN